jgi:hypothetical protein
VALRELLDRVLGLLRDAAAAVDRTHFVHQHPQWSLVGPAGHRSTGRDQAPGPS